MGLFFGQYATLRNVNPQKEGQDKVEVNENDIRELVSLSKNMGGAFKDTIQSAVIAFGISEKEAKAYVEKFWQ